MLVDFSVDCLGGYLVSVGKYPFLSNSRMLYLVNICLVLSRAGEEARDGVLGRLHADLSLTCGFGLRSVSELRRYSGQQGTPKAPKKYTKLTDFLEM